MRGKWQERNAEVWYWCLHCERLYQPRHAIRDAGAWVCPDGCHAVAYLDWIPLAGAVARFGIVLQEAPQRGLRCAMRVTTNDGKPYGPMGLA